MPADAVVDEVGTPLAAPWGISFTVEEEGAPNMYLSAYPRRVMEGNNTRVSIWFEMPATTARDIGLSSNGAHLEMPSFVTLEAGESLVELTVRASASRQPGRRGGEPPGDGPGHRADPHRPAPCPERHAPDLGPLWLTSTVLKDEDGDGVFESGETADVLLQVANLGSQGISGVYLEFAVLDNPNLHLLGGSFRCDIGFLAGPERRM